MRAGGGCEARVGGLSLWNMVSCCMEYITSNAERDCLQELCKAGNSIWK